MNVPREMNAEHVKSSTGGDEVVGTLLADRTCRTCGMNLHGRPMKREKHYALLVVECPQCGQVAPCQEYPALGEWPARWHAVTAVFWVAFILLMVSISIQALSVTVNLNYAASARLINTIAIEHYEWYQERFPVPVEDGQPPRQLSVDGSEESALHPDWLREKGGAEFIQKAGGWFQSVRMPALGRIVVLLIECLFVGALWSMVLSHWKKRWLWTPALGAGFLIYLVMASGYASQTSYFDGYPLWSGRDNEGQWAVAEFLAPSYIIPTLCVVLSAIITVLLFVSLMVGRPMARWFIRALLAPRLRGPFSFLWTCDGLTPPVPGAHLRRW